MNVGAQLPDGQVLSFPEGTPQDVVGRAVKKHLGLPVPPTADEMARQQDLQIEAARNQAIAAVAQSVAQLNQSVAAASAMLAKVTTAVERLDRTVAEAAKLVHAGVTAPQSMTVTRDEKGRVKETHILRGAR